MTKLKIDSREVEVPEGATVLDAARSAGVEIPTLCFLEELEPSTSCMICVVRIDGSRQMVPSCATIAREGMEVESENEAVLAARRTALELLLSEHTGDCVAPCQRADQRHVDIPRLLRLVGEGEFELAAATLEAAGVDLEHVEEDEFLRGEKACRRGRFDETVAIGEVMRLVARSRANSNAEGIAPLPYREFTVRSGSLSPEEMQELLADASAELQVAPDDTGAGFTPDEASREARRCLHCDCRQAHSCNLRDASESLGAKRGAFRAERPPLEQDHSHPDIIHEPGKCILCGNCLQVAEREGERLGIAFVGRGHQMRVKVPFDEPLAEALRTSGGACADVCPTGALVRKVPPGGG
jgi:ferredoxin